MEVCFLAECAGTWSHGTHKKVLLSRSLGNPRIKNSPPCVSFEMIPSSSAKVGDSSDWDWRTAYVTAVSDKCFVSRPSSCTLFYSNDESCYECSVCPQIHRLTLPHSTLSLWRRVTLTINFSRLSIYSLQFSLHPIVNKTVILHL